MRRRPIRPRPRPRLPLLAAVLILGACAHAPRVDDAELTGRWEGTATPQGRGEEEPFALRLDLVVSRGQVTGTGEMAPPAGQREGRSVFVEGEFRGGRAILRFESEGLGPHVLRVRLTEPDRLEGSLETDRPAGLRPVAGQGYRMRIDLARVAP
jgi:hypothetical protein